MQGSVSPVRNLAVHLVMSLRASKKGLRLMRDYIDYILRIVDGSSRCMPDQLLGSSI